ncbi:MAG: triose-phosphate isomerase [Tissierellales bacterium]|nr:triose-phosphate isomerase [Tissierellales bacterium]
MRKPIIAGNWKMNNTIVEGQALVSDILNRELNESVEAVICVPFTFLQTASKMVDGNKIKLGAQNMHWEEKGAYTGEISPLMLNELNVEYVIIGHSERRQYFNETDKTVNMKTISALSHNITPIVCVGESLQERENDSYKELIEDQVRKAFEGISTEDAKKTVIAYEPIWAIGTGRTASSEQAEEICQLIRNVLTSLYDEKTAQAIRILYGGSVKPENIKELMAMENIDGALVGGASLKADDFVQLINY